MESYIKFYSFEDFVEQILSRLPPKSLMRFQCVCNLWCHSIKSPNFVAKHLFNSMRASSMPVLFKRAVHKDKNGNIKDVKQVDNDDDNVETLLSSLNLCNEDDDDYLLTPIVEDLSVPLPTHLKLRHSSDLRMVGHCDGMICLRLFIGNVILCNSSMKEFKLVPKSFLLLPNDEFNLDFEFRYYSEYLGFGYDPKGKDYKIVRFVIYEESCYWFRAEVFTMKSNSWRDIKTEYNSQVNWCADLPIYGNGICYWHISGNHRACGDFILSFDMGSELFHEILIPDLPNGCTVVTLAMWKKLISLFTYQENIGVPQPYVMWVMMDDHADGRGSWTKHLAFGPGDQCPMLFWNSDLLLMFADTDGQIVLNKIGTQILKYLPVNTIRGVCNEALVYVNSIVSINGGNKLEDISISAFYGRGKFHSSYGGKVDISIFDGDNKLEP